MAFPNIESRMVPLLSDIEDVPDDLPLLFGDGCFFFRVPLAESECGRWVVSLDVGYREYKEISPCDGMPVMKFVTLGYEVTLNDMLEPAEYQTMDPLETRGAIPLEMRPLVIDIACKCYERLIADCDPEYIFRVTWLTQLSESAMVKHTRATEVLTQAGYVVLKDGTDQQGSKFWLLGKADSDHSGLKLEQPGE